MGVHFAMDSSGILKVDKAESVIEMWEEYEVEVPVEAPKVESASTENVTIESRETLESDVADDREVHATLDFEFHIWLPAATVHHLRRYIGWAFMYSCLGSCVVVSRWLMRCCQPGCLAAQNNTFRKACV